MKVVGIIAEYNPFHNGHYYHLQESKKITKADYTIIVMSGDFMQRGTPAIIDKYQRTKMALACGADLVLELPSYYATSSAEHFALGSISILNSLGVVTDICFGSESGDINTLESLANILTNEPPEYQSLLRKSIREGNTFPKAREIALTEYCQTNLHLTPALSSPNNVLGIEYLKAIKRLNSDITPNTILRKGSGYHDDSLNNELSSAYAIRTAIKNREDSNFILSQLPFESNHLMKNIIESGHGITLNDFSELLFYKLQLEHLKGFTSYLDVSRELSDRIINNLSKYTDYTTFCELLKTKEITHSRVARCLMHILLDMKKKDFTPYLSEQITYYARILGFQKASTTLLSEIKKNTSIPLISKLADASNYLTNKGLSMLEKDILTSHIYESIANHKYQIPFKNEYIQSPIIWEELD